MTDQPTLSVALGDYPHTLPLKRGEIKPQGLILDFPVVKPANRAFAPMAREQKFDVSEMAIVTYLQAKAYNKPIVLMPVTMFARFQHHTMLYDSTRGVIAPKDLAGRRLGMRAYTQTTGAWVRGILSKDYGVDLNKSHWVTFEDAHVAEFSDPPGVERAAAGKDITKMLLDGELDAAIFGGEMPDDPRLQSVIPNPQAEARAWYQKYKAVPINHMVVVTTALSRLNSAAVRELYRVFMEGKKAAGPPAPGEPDMIPSSVQGCRSALELIIEFAAEQRLIPRRFSVEELFDDTTGALN